MSQASEMERSESSWRTTARLIGEFMREAAVLVAVFVPLDWTVENRPLTTSLVVAIIVVVAGLMSVGVLLEMKGR